MARRYKGETFYCKHCGGFVTMKYHSDPREGEGWFPVLHTPFDCIDEISHRIGTRIPSPDEKGVGGVV